MAIDMSGIKAAMFNTPSNYNNSREYYEQNLLDKINDTYQYASNTYSIGKETSFGSLSFNPVLCRVCHAIDPKTGKNLGDDFKDLKFFTLDPKRIMGERYEFENSIWITTNTDNYHYSTQSAIIRRCNNTLNYINSNGDIVREPCIVGYSIKYANIYYNTAVEIPQGTISITLQNNENTKNIQINDRFILGSSVFKVKNVTDYLRSDTYIFGSVPIIELEVYMDAISPDDNFDLGIAGMSKYSDIYPNETVLNGFVVEPKERKIYKGDTVSFSCYNYIKNIKQSDTFTFTPSGVDSNFYVFDIINGNEFSITCLNNSNKFLEITCTNGEQVETISIELGGIY